MADAPATENPVEGDGDKKVPGEPPKQEESFDPKKKREEDEAIQGDGSSAPESGAEPSGFDTDSNPDAGEESIMSAENEEVPTINDEEEAGEENDEDEEVMLAAPPEPEIPITKLESLVATSGGHLGSSESLMMAQEEEGEDNEGEEEEEEEEDISQPSKIFVPPPPVREDPLHPDLKQWEKESRVWFNSDLPLDYSPIDSIDNRISDEEVQDKYAGVLGDIKCVFVDFDGTLVNIGYDTITPTPGAVEAFNLLKEVGLKVYLVVNTWLDSKATTVALVSALGFEVDETSVFTSSDCSKLLMKKHGLLHPFLLVSDDVHQDYDGMETSDLHDFDSVVVGLPCTMIDYRLLTRAIQILSEEHPLMILHPSRNDKIENASEIMGPGVFGNVLNFATDANTLVPAKPAPGFFLEACQIAGVCPHECIMIGDDISVDVKGSKAAMCKSILVKTGVYKRNDESKYCTWIPEVVADDFASAVRILLCAQSKFPKPPEEDPETVQRLASMQRERDSFNRKLAAYDSSDCNRKTRKCLPKLPSLIW